MATKENRLNPALGFYIKYGGRDVPINVNPRAKIGEKRTNAKTGETSPIFNYSINDIQDFLYNNYQYNNSIVVENEEYIQTIVFENAKIILPIYTQLTKSTFTTSGYEDLFRAMDLIYENESDIYGPTTGTLRNDSQRLSVLRGILNRTKPSSTGKYIDDFTEGFHDDISLGFDEVNHRITYAYFFFDIGINKLNREPKEFIIFFSPDAMVSEYFDTNKYDVTFTTATLQTDSNRITSVLTNSLMFQNRLSVSTTTINTWSYSQLEINRNYKTFTQVPTTYRVVGTDKSIIEEYKRIFVIHSHLRTPLTGYDKINIIRNYIYDKVFPDGKIDPEKLAYLFIEYPEIFFKYTIDIFPYCREKKDNLKYTSIISLKEINEFLAKNDLHIPDQKSLEVFLLEGIGRYDNVNMNVDEESGEKNKNLTMPLLAICQNDIPYIGPISDTFASYRPTYSGEMYVSGADRQFNFYVKKLIKLVLGIYQPSNSKPIYVCESPTGVGGDVNLVRDPNNKNFLDRDDPTDLVLAKMLNIPPELDLTTEREDVSGVQTIKVVKFIFGNAIIKLHGIKPVA